MSQDIEVEIKVKVEKIEPLLEFLEKKGKFKGEKHQIDRYFTPAHRDFLSARPTKEWLRIRNSDGKASITYKDYHYDETGKSLYCDEYETEVVDEKQIEKIFAAINIKQLTVVDKVRKIWMWSDFEIAVDSVKNLGDFVEVEFKGDVGKKTPKEISKSMINFLKQFDLGKITRDYVGYPFMLMFPNEVVEEEI